MTILHMIYTSVHNISWNWWDQCCPVLGSKLLFNWWNQIWPVLSYKLEMESGIQGSLQSLGQDNTGGHFLLVITRSKGLAVCSHMDSNFAPRFPTFWVISNHELHWSILRRIRTWPEWKSISRWIRTWQECIATWTDWTNAPSIGSLSCVG
jgi:hypothetical protein